MKKPRGRKPKKVAQEISQADLAKRMSAISGEIKTRREEMTTIEAFAYEINISRNSQIGYENGGDMYLSTFLKLLHGLDVTPDEFFQKIQSVFKK